MRILRMVDLSLAVTAAELQISVAMDPEPPRGPVIDGYEQMRLYVPPDDAGVLDRARDFNLFRDAVLIELAAAAFRALALPHASFATRIAAPSDPDLDLELARHGLVGSGFALKEAGFDREVRTYQRARRLRRGAFVRMLKWADVSLGSLSLIPVLTAVVDPIKEFKEVIELLAEHEPHHRPKRQRRS